MFREMKRKKQGRTPFLLFLNLLLFLIFSFDITWFHRNNDHTEDIQNHPRKYRGKQRCNNPNQSNDGHIHIQILCQAHANAGYFLSRHNTI